MFFDYFISVLNYFFVAYALSITGIYVILTIISIIEIVSYRQTKKYTNHKELLSSPFAPTVSLIAPAYNEGLSIVENIRSLLSIQYHAIEFLLWGQDFNMAPGSTTPDYTLSGQRPVTDFTTDALADRRKTYLTLITDQLITDLTYLVNAWADDSAWGRKAFLAQTDDEALKDIFNGMGKLSKGELAGERMYVALTNKDQEDEHSCFSDNTHRDIVQNFMGIKNVWEGTYGSINGASVRDLIHENNKALGEKIDEKFASTLVLVNAIDANKPFDELIASGDVTKENIVKDAVFSLQELGDLLVEGAAGIGISFIADLEE